MTRIQPLTNRPTLRDIADEVGVSKNAVAKVLLGTGGQNTRVSDETARRIRAVAHKVQYRPNQIARQLLGQPSRTLGIIADSRGQEVHHKQLTQLQLAAEDAGYRVMVAQARSGVESFRRCIEGLVDRHVDGLICFSHTEPDVAEEIEQLFQHVPHHVFVAAPLSPQLNQASYVEPDIKAGVERLVDHLADRGRSRLSILTGKRAYKPIADRLEGFTTAVRRRGLKLDRQRMIACDCEPTQVPIVAPLVDRLLEQKTDAIVASNDLCALAVIRYLIQERAVRVPEDVAVTGYDNTDAAALAIPSLTTIDQDAAGLAEQVINMLKDRIEHDGKPGPRQVVLPPKLVVRESA